MTRIRDEHGVGSTGVFLAVVALVAVVGLAAIRIYGHGAEPEVSRTRRDPAPSFARVAAWINSEPLTIESLRGDVVLVDFWTYSCINCLRTIPGLQALYDRYRASGFQIVGVHSPEFGFEKVEANVRAAVARLGVTWPVCLDNDRAVWDAYRNAYWPHVYLVDRSGSIRYDKIGEGDEAQLEEHVRALLGEGGHALPSPVNLPEPSFPSTMTPEIYAGYERGEEAGTIANAQGYVHDRAQRYTGPDARTLERARDDGPLYPDGTWFVGPEAITARSPGKVLLPFTAGNVFVVAAASPVAEVTLRLDGRPVDEPGTDTKDSRVAVGASRLYALVRLATPGRHVLELDVPAGFALYTFTFG
jgi:thiol-disulfide isomerase/thioredoxin